MCPHCRRPILITDADVRAAEADERILPVQTEAIELLEAIPLDFGALRLAPEGSRPGLTGRQALDHEEAMLANVIRGRATIGATYEDLNPVAAGGAAVFIEFEPGKRAFVHDLLASFYFVGVTRNALNMLAVAVACSLLVGLQYLLFFLGPLWLFMIPVYGLIAVYLIQFYWSVLRMTAAGEDVMPWSQADSSLWHDGVKPFVWLVGVSLLCTAPRWLLGRFGPPELANDTAALWVALGAGWFFWPVAVMSVALGNTILFARPDWLIRCVIGIGPVYIVAWLAVMIAVAGWLLFLQFWQFLVWIPVVPFAINLYVGYVVFRTIGLLFRHFRARFPWKY